MYSTPLVWLAETYAKGRMVQFLSRACEGKDVFSTKKEMVPVWIQIHVTSVNVFFCFLQSIIWDFSKMSIPFKRKLFEPGCFGISWNTLKHMRNQNKLDESWVAIIQGRENTNTNCWNSIIFWNIVLEVQMFDWFWKPMITCDIIEFITTWSCSVGNWFFTTLIPTPFLWET